MPIHKGWLLALAFVGALSHPAMDWLNNYGVRLLEPFSSQWFYGDSIFIIDIWILTILGLGIGWSWRRERRGNHRRQRPAKAALLALCVYIFGNVLITGMAKDHAQAAIDRRPARIVVSPVPLAFWRREIFWQVREVYGAGNFDLLGTSSYYPQGDRGAFSDPRVGQATAADVDASAFLFWSRMPTGRIERRDGVDTLTLGDQRFQNRLVADRFAVKLRLPTKNE